MANSELATTIAQAVQESLEAYSGAMTTAEILAALEADEAALEGMTDRVYDLFRYRQDQCRQSCYPCYS